MADPATNGKLDEERARRQKRAQLKDLNIYHAGDGMLRNIRIQYFAVPCSRSLSGNLAGVSIRTHKSTRLIPEAPHRPHQTHKALHRPRQPRPDH